MSDKTIIRDLTTGSVTKTLLAFSWPLMLSNLLQIVYNMVDMVVVGRFVGSAGLAAVACGGDLLHLVTTLCMGFTSAGQIMISQYIGLGDHDSVRKTVGTMFSFISLLSVVTMIAGILSADWLLGAINVPAEAFAQAREYSICCFSGMFFIFGYNTVSAILRGMGDSKRPFIFIAVAAVINLVLDLIFVAGLNLGPQGAALATVIGQGASFIGSLVYLYVKRESFGFDFKPGSFAIDLPVFKILCRMGVPMALQHSAITVSRMFVNSFINAFGVVASAVNGVGGRIGMCAMVVSVSLSAAGTSMTGQNFGAGKLDRIKKTVYVSWGFGLAYSLLLSVFMILFPERIFGLFNSDPGVLEMARSYVLIAVMMFLGFALRSPMMALMNGLGNAGLSLAVGILDGIIIRIGMAVFLGVGLNMGIMGFWIGDIIAGFVPFIIGGVYFWSGMWTRRKLIVREKPEPV